jgi:sec-independent protein translocase protein TatB
VFGLSFGELCVLLIVAMVVLGPKELPRYLRKAGEFAGRMRRLAYEMREKSGIDEVLRTEGLDRDIAEFRKLARGELGVVAAAVRSATDAVRIGDGPANSYAATVQTDAQPVAANGTSPVLPEYGQPREVVAREREYPREGSDSYGALPDTAVVYEGSLPASPLAGDALYTRGEPPTEATTASASPPPEASASSPNA